MLQPDASKIQGHAATFNRFPLAFGLGFRGRPKKERARFEVSKACAGADGSRAERASAFFFNSRTSRKLRSTGHSFRQRCISGVCRLRLQRILRPSKNEREGVELGCERSFGVRPMFFLVLIS